MVRNRLGSGSFLGGAGAHGGKTQRLTTGGGILVRKGETTPHMAATGSRTEDRSWA